METEDLSEESIREESILQLVRGILQDARTLSGQEVTAAKLEVRQEISKAIKGTISLGTGGFIIAIGILLISLMFVFLLSAYTVIPLWGSFGIIGLIYLIIGGIALLVGKKKVANVKPYPGDSVESAKQDVRLITQRASGH